ncbi:hypothetical protein [Rubellicoccus peritrichatus]|uniref:Uncharacterized protein n=1 Tax=Rubellicoccus peritrichatus TaxID=3080537 RepID=A0AAQ3LCG9_9BACT|nr:hypothetical protein [Puniceicoccus sp. CR14]WOO41335.1 hypothetical protein RZN69_22175 [Puniceicoccus sp. CR14]
MEKYSRPNNILINDVTNTVVKTTGVHGDKTMGYQFEAYRLLENGEWAEEPELFRKQPFSYKEGSPNAPDGQS